MGKMSRLGNDLYQGRKSIDFTGRRLLWYGVTILIVAAAVAGLAVRGLNFGVEFTGGTTFSVAVGAGNASQDNADALRDAIGAANIENADQPVVTTAGDQALTVQVQNLSPEERQQVEDVIEQQFPDVAPNDVSTSDVGPSWGKEVAQRAAIGVGIFLILVVIFIWAYFREWKMSVAALIALIHDVAITVGVYAWSGFEVTPAAVTGLLAILGFSLYDTVVVFDKIKENTTKLRRRNQSYGDAANLAVNQTLVRSINTSIVALIPIGAILYVSAVQLGASSLQDLALAQFVGMGAGVYSSVMLAPRVIVNLKSLETEVQEQARRAKARQRAEAADRYAAVPAVTAGRPARETGPEGLEDDDSFRIDVEETDDESVQPAQSPTVAGRGRTVPTQHRPVAPSSSSGRNQPVRDPRSKRGKK
ncbi:protein translocase subunit SecF [Nocardioides panacisoli]|uniref:Protein-export membrane protein SecF n=1 Tax=Nocardioides panacisoli TaxID=627624 RepID=A0ABP7J1U7_9ACTN